MLENKNKTAFTLTEIIVVVTILTILTTISFVYFSDNISSTRDTKRLSDIASIESALRLHKQKKGSFPYPGNSFNILNSSTSVALQGELNRQVRLPTLESLLEDPKLKKPYVYSITKTKQEFELSATLENEDLPKAVVSGNYKSVSKNILPTISLAHVGSDLEITNSENRKLFLFNQLQHNLPYTFDGSGGPYSKGIDFSNLILEAEINNYWQNSDYTSCLDIYEANKSIGDGIYQHLSGGSLVDITCTMSDAPLILN